MAASSSHEPATATGGPVAESEGSSKTEELGAQITDLKKKQHDLLREKKKLQAVLRNAQRKKQRLTKRTRMLTDGDLLDIMRMRAAQTTKEKDADDKSTTTSQSELPGAAAPLGTQMDTDEQQAAAASEGNAEQLPDSPAE